MKPIIDCNTCRHHVQGATLDDVHGTCWNCVNTPQLIHWEPKQDPEAGVLAAAAKALAEGLDAAILGVPFKKPQASAPQLLNKAAELMAERGKQYDKPEGERSMGKCVTAFNAITGKDLTEAEGWLLLQLLKDVRLWQRKGYHQDSAEDCIAYAALKAEAKQAENP